MKYSQIQKSGIVIFKTKEGPQLDVRLDRDTVWLTQKQMSSLFNKGIPTINEHIKNIYKENELKENSTIRKFRIVQTEGGRQIKREVDFYSLDVIISVGYRVKSLRGTQFRIWASKILKRYLIKGFALNEKRLQEVKGRFENLQQAILFLQQQSQNKLLKGQETELLNLIADYSKTLSILEQYDSGKVKEKKGTKTNFILDYFACKKIIIELKKELITKKEAGELFGQERDDSFAGIIKGIYQTFESIELYPTIEEKAAHLLYFIIKDHPFSDGNKRTASFLFVYFLDKSSYLFKESGERKINDNALTALALLIAESDPKDKEIMIKIIKSLLSEA